MVFDPFTDMPKELMRGNIGSQFVPKLTEEERCEIYAMYRVGISGNVLAIAYGVNRRTITHLTRESSKHYRKVRDLYFGMGHKAFITRYVTEQAAQRVKDAKTSRDVEKSMAKLDEEAAKARLENQPSAPRFRRGSKQKEGFHSVSNINTELPHRVEIRWLDATEAAADATEGWYWQDENSDNPQTWYGVNNMFGIMRGPLTGFATSTQALAGAQEHVID